MNGAEGPEIREAKMCLSLPGEEGVWSVVESQGRTRGRPRSGAMCQQGKRRNHVEEVGTKVMAVQKAARSNQARAGRLLELKAETGTRDRAGKNDTGQEERAGA